MKAINIRVEHLLNPSFLDVRHPLITWNVDKGNFQKAYRVRALSSNEVIFDSGKVESSSMRAELTCPLSSRQEVEVEITLFDEDGIEGEKAYKSFEMSLLNKEEFVAKFIRGNYKVNKKKRYPVDCFKKEFETSKVIKARLYSTALGVYEAKINSKKVGDLVLTPGHTDYRKRIQLQGYDVTSLINEGKNVIELELADGWYRGSCGAWGIRNQYGKVTKILAQLELYFENGEKKIIGTDSSWSWSSDGPIRFADNKDGEIIDASLIPSYSSKAKETEVKVLPKASNNVEVREHETFKPVKVIKTPKGSTVLDFGQNIAGYISFKINAKKGQIIKLRFGEMFDKEGEFTQKNIQCANKKRTRVSPLQQVIYTCKEGLNEYKTKFAVFGFQYVLVETEVKYDKDDFDAIAVYSSFEETLKFNCSNKLINKLVESTRWSAKNNHLDVPTDCPTRERHGWTGDAQIFCNTASYLFNYAPFARKYVNDMKDSQRRDGRYRQISPRGGTDFYMASMDGSAGWSDAGVLIPYRIYKRYNDKRILEEHYDEMYRYAKFKAHTLGRPYLTSLPLGVKLKDYRNISNYGQSYGEWAEPVDVRAFSISDFISPHPEETTAYIVYMLEHMVEICHILGKEEDAKYFAKYIDRARKGYKALIKSKKHSLDTDRQAKLVRPLYMHLLDKEDEEFAKKRLVKALDNYNWRLGTGFLSTPFILYVLMDINKDYAFRLLENEEMPGWLFMPKMNANTIWESWEGTEAQGGVASLDHYSKGAVVEWLVDTMAGIKLGDEENTFIISPHLGGKENEFSASYLSIYGEISVKSILEGDVISFEVIVPPNTKATFIYEDGSKKDLEPGRHRL